jgi:hypothetical protein
MKDLDIIHPIHNVEYLFDFDYNDEQFQQLHLYILSNPNYQALIDQFELAADDANQIEEKDTLDRIYEFLESKSIVKAKDVDAKIYYTSTHPTSGLPEEFLEFLNQASSDCTQILHYTN